MPTPQECILLFLRAPEKGRVKTRLAASLGKDPAFALYKSFVLDILDIISAAGCRVFLYGHPVDKVEEISLWLGSQFPCRPQIGENLGSKMANAFSEVFADGFEKAVLVGSDIPDLPLRIIHQAFSALDREGAALGPAADGGYYMIAFRKSVFLPSVFENISWSTDKVLAQTLTAFKEAGTPVHLLEKWRDIDTVEDLKALMARHPTIDSAAPRTLTYLRQRELEVHRVP